MRSRWFLPLLFCCASALSLVFPTAVFAGRILLENARIHGSSQLSPGQTSFVVFNDGKIESIGELDPRLKVDQRIDLQGASLYPGIIALNTALGLSEISALRPTRDIREVGQYTADVQSWIAVNPDSELLPVARANGVAYIEPAPQGGVVAGQSGLITVYGWTIEEMAVKTPLGMHIYWPSMQLNTTPKDKAPSTSRWKSMEEQSRDRRQRLQELNEFFEDARAYATAKAAGDSRVFQKDPAWEAMLPFISGQLPLMIHADEVRQIKTAVEWATTNQFKFIIVGGRDAWRIADELAAKRVPVLFEHTFTQPNRDSDSHDVHFKAPAVLHRAGVPFAIGMGATAFDAALIKNVPYQAAQSIGYGLPREEALKAITLYPAQFIGMDDRIGSIDVGKEATFFVCDGDILDIRAQVKRMWIAGNEVSLENRHTRLFEKYRNRPRSTAGRR